MNRAWRNFAIGVVLALIIISLTPYLWMFLASVKTRVDALAATPQWFFAPTLEHYRTVFVQKHYLPLVGNSIMVASGTTLLSLLVGTPAAYVFARHQFAGKEDLFFFFLTTRMAPAVSVVVPMFLLFGKLGLLDSLYAVILAHSSFNLSLVVWMMRSFFEEIPPEVDEAAQMDGN
ncbi:MAG: carbohydrate ABC transporter permease, partial [Desulforhabdus sp.]|nr:carbohydrate ABC transporter permease [Desulforhabdus sp.]